MLTQKLIMEMFVLGIVSAGTGLGVWLELEKLYDFICEKGIDKLLIRWYN
jgi:hypothetical protein